MSVKLTLVLSGAESAISADSATVSRIWLCGDVLVGERFGRNRDVPRSWFLPGRRLRERSCQTWLLPNRCSEAAAAFAAALLAVSYTFPC